MPDAFYLEDAVTSPAPTTLTVGYVRMSSFKSIS